ncbi:MAG: YlxR family protein [Clostridia bacterium]|nr:YlxR family protein [Lachnospiraceae bacterium]MBR3495079.1 YlxR family protein [Clostridia bacterium]
MPQKPKKIPMRMCVGCREMKPKGSLIRVVRAPNGEVSLDPVGKKPGRGAYVCRDVACLNRAIRQKQLERQLETSLGEETAAQLRQMLAECTAEEADPGG